MKAPFTDLFLAIQQRIAHNAPSIVHIAHEHGQLKTKGRPPVSWPCVLIDFEDFKFSNLSEDVQMASGIVVLQLGFAPQSPTAQGTPDPYKLSALSYYSIESELHVALHGWSPAGTAFGSLCRVSATTQKRADMYRVRELRYSISFDDYSTKPEQTYAPAELVVSVGGGGGGHH
jgi:hypothetical protein